MNAKLDNITTQYRKFNENQVLTEGQLNEFIDYFEDQDRLSRTRLSGVGIVCGFKSTFLEPLVAEALVKRISMEEAQLQSNVILITQGAGVTTDGDLITLRRKIEKTEANSDKKTIETVIDFNSNAYRYYRDYKDELNYNHFRIGKNQIPLLEIITQQDYELLKSQGLNVDDFKEVKDIDKLSDKIVILYLESYSNEESPCEDADCDNAGAEQVSNLRVLLADSQSVSDLLTKGDAKDTLYKLHNQYEKLFDNLPNIEAKRVILDPAITTASQLKTRFYDSINAVPALIDGFDKLSATFNLNDTSINAKISSLLNTSTLSLGDYQYRYDLFKDLIDTYNEIKGLLLHLDAECCPSINSFPKHLMLGAVGDTLELGEKADLRHSFYHSPVTTGDDENYERVIMLIKRFIEKVNKFKSHNGPIKITPSNLYVRLGNKAIPYYYNVDKPLLAQWNFEKTKTDRETYNLSYHTASLAGDDYVQNPLNYNIDNYDFYRIEGHLGLPYETAVQNINYLKVQYGLAFDVAVLLLNKGEKRDDLPTEPRKLSIEDLRKQLISISDDISKEKGDSKSTLLNLSKLDSDLKLLNRVAFATSESEKEVTIVKEDPRKEEISTELLSDFLERKSGLEHLAGVEPGGTFVLIAESETSNEIIADFSLPYLCCSKEKPNIPPIAVDDRVSCLRGETVIIPVLNNDYDADNDLLTVVKKSNPSHGIVVLNSDGTFSYTHDGSVNLEDSFTYCVNDGKDDSNIATVFIKIKMPPKAVNDHASTESGGYVDIPVKNNDEDLGNTPVSVHLAVGPTNGTASVNPDGTIRYIHTVLANLTDSFTYYLNNGELDSNIATVTIAIAPPPCDAGMDVVFIFDYTASMSGQIEAAKAGVASIISTIDAQSGDNDYRLGLVIADEYNTAYSAPWNTPGYRYAPSYTSLPAAQRFINDGAGTSEQWITAMEVMPASTANYNNELTFKQQLNKINNSSGLVLGNGGGAPEPTDMALSRVVEHDFAGAFRNNVAKYVIIITDITPGGNDDIANALDVNEINRLKQVCIQKSIKVIVLGRGVGDSQYSSIEGTYIWRDLATATGGSYNVSYSATTIVAEITNGCS